VLAKLREITVNEEEFRNEARALLSGNELKWLSDKNLSTC